MGQGPESRLEESGRGKDTGRGSTPLRERLFGHQRRGPLPHGDPPDQAARIIDQQDDLQITDVVLAETAYVLTSVYQVPRDVVVDHLIALVQKENISPFALDMGLVLHALLLCRPSARVSFADAIRSAGAKVVYSLDERFPRNGLEVRSTA